MSGEGCAGMKPIVWRGLPMMGQKFSILALLNMVLLQWLFLRLNVARRTETEQVCGVGVLFPVLPLTGWSSRFIPKKPLQIWFWASDAGPPVFGIFVYGRIPQAEAESS